MMRWRKKSRAPFELNEMPNRGGLIETDSVRHFFDIMETDLFFLYGSFCKMQCCASPAQSARKVGITDKTAVLEIARKMQTSVTGKMAIFEICP